MEELHGRAEMGRIGRTGHLGVECTETEAQRTLDVEMIGKQMEAQNHADRL